MKLKYYLRGLGIGVIVTTIILAIALGREPEALTDAQIKERAAELGMVEENLIKENDNVTASGEALTPGTQGAVAVAEDDEKTTPSSSSTTKPTTTTTTTTTTTKKTTTKATTTKAPPEPAREETDDGTYITIEIGASDWSNHVARKLADAGLVESAADFDQYLIQNGYESIIASGSHRFKIGASYAELAQELVRHH